MAEKMGYLPSKSVCRICLATNVKMYSIHYNGIQRLYEEVTGVNVSIVDGLPQAVCWECFYRLLKCYRFRNQALLTHSLLKTLLETEGCVTENNIKKIDRFKHGLQSKLKSITTSNYFEVKVCDEEVCVDNKNQNGTIMLSVEHADIKEEFDDHHAETEKEIIKDFSDNSDIEKEYSDAIDKDSDSHDSNFEIEEDKPVKKKSEKSIKPKVKTTINKFMFTITSLTLEEQIREIEKRKLTDNYIQSEFKCDKCYKGFLYESAFKFHMTRHTNKSGKHSCEVCKVHFKTVGAVKHHALCHCQKFACNLCPYVTSRLHTAKLHEAFHNGAQYTCEHCEEVFTKQTTYMSHLRVKHPSDFVCELCGNSFISQKGLFLHKKLKHRFDEAITPQEKHRCEQCDLSFVKKEALQTHLRAKHNIGVREAGVIARRRKGSDPDTARRNKILSRRYARGRPPAQPVRCEQCDATLADPRAYYAHFRREHPDKNRTQYPAMRRHHPCMCEVCGRIFKCRSLLDDHSNTHAADVQFKCPHCDKVFRTRYSLALHSRAHSGRRAVFTCSVCEKNFSTRSNLVRHEFSHTGLKPYKCEMCGKSFKYADERRSHVQYVHLKKPYPKRVRARRSTKQDASKPLVDNDRWQDDGEKND